MSTRLKVKEEEVSFVDYKLLKKEIARLGMVKKNVIIEINSENRKLSDLKGESTKIKADNDKLIADAKTEAEGIVAEAKERRTEALKLENEVKGKIAKAEAREKQADNLIKSNEGKEKNLAASKENVAEIKAKLTKVLDLVKDVI